jgi:hypothetical protein
MGLFSGFGDFFSGLGRGLGNAGGGARGAANATGNAGAAARGAGNAGAADKAAGNASGTVPRDTTLPDGSDARQAAASDPRNATVPSRDAGAAANSRLKPGDIWKPLVGLAFVGAAVTITALMLKKANDGAKNNGKTYNIVSLKNKNTTGTIVTCQFTPSIEPNGVVVKDSITISGTGTALDGNEFTITTRTSSHSTLVFDAGSRLGSEIKNKGSFVLHTSFENQMDNQAKNLGGGVGGFFSNLFQGLFGGIFGDAAGLVGYALMACCCLICCIAIILLISKLKQ